jgi:hypothetical protein
MKRVYSFRGAVQFTDLKVFREKDNIDILLQSDSNKLIVLIENKYLSSEHTNQLNRYLDSIKKH